MPLLCVGPLNDLFLWCRLWFYDCLRSSTEIEAFPTFFSGTNGNAIFSWNLWLFHVVQKFSSLNSEISRVFCRFIFRKYTFSCRFALLPSEIFSSCRSDELYVSSYVVVTTYFMEQTSTIHSVDIEFTYAFLSCHFPSNTKYSVLILFRLMINSMKTSFAQQSIAATPSANHMK